MPANHPSGARATADWLLRLPPRAVAPPAEKICICRPFRVGRWMRLLTSVGSGSPVAEDETVREVAVRLLAGGALREMLRKSGEMAWPLSLLPRWAGPACTGNVAPDRAARSRDLQAASISDGHHGDCRLLALDVAGARARIVERPADDRIFSPARSRAERRCATGVLHGAVEDSDQLAAGRDRKARSGPHLDHGRRTTTSGSEPPGSPVMRLKLS